MRDSETLVTQRFRQRPDFCTNSSQKVICVMTLLICVMLVWLPFWYRFYLVHLSFILHLFDHLYWKWSWYYLFILWIVHLSIFIDLQILENYLTSKLNQKLQYRGGIRDLFCPCWQVTPHISGVWLEWQRNLGPSPSIYI